MTKHRLTRILLPGLVVMAAVISLALFASRSMGFQPSHTVTVGTTTAYEFYAPASDIQCELSRTPALGTYAYCQSVSTNRSVKMTANGSWTVCSRENCLGNPGLGTPTLHTSTRVLDGPITCDLTADTVSCYNRLHRGFVMWRTTLANYSS